MRRIVGPRIPPSGALGEGAQGTRVACVIVPPAEAAARLRRDSRCRRTCHDNDGEAVT